MIRRTTKWLLRITAGIATGLAVLLALGLWRLSQGPVPLDLVLPYIEENIAPADGSVRFKAREVTLNWAGWDRTLEIRVGALEAIGANGDTLASVPQAAVRLSLLALASGDIAPTVIQLEKLHLRVVLAEDGRLDIGQTGEQETGGRFLSLLIDQLLARDEQAPLISRLERVVISGAEIVFEDRRKALRWHSPNAEVVLTQDQQGVLGEAAIEVEAEGQRALLNVRALFSREDRNLAVSVNFDGIRPAVLAALEPVALRPLTQVDLVFSGTVDARVSSQGRIESLIVNVASGPGTIGRLGLFPEARAIRRSAMRGEVNVGNGTLRIDELTVDFGEIAIDMKGEGAISGGIVSFGAALSGDRLATRDLEKFWPPAMSPGGRGWTLANIEGGEARNLRLNFELTGDLDRPETVSISNVTGSADFSGLTVHYLRPMPPVQGVGGTMRLTDTAVRFEVKSGELGDIALNEASIALANLDQPVNHRAHIDLTSTGPLAAKLRLLEHPKVGLQRDFAVGPERVSGQISTRAVIELPLIDSLTMAQVEFAASASTAAVSIRNVVADLDLTDAALTLQLNGREMEVRGKGKLAGQQSDLSWHVNFTRAAWMRRYEVKTTMQTNDLERLAGFDLPQVRGAVGVQAIMTEAASGQGTVVAVLDLKNAAIDVPEIGWRKETGRDAGGRIGLDLRNGKPGERIELELMAADLQAQAALQVSGTGVQRAEIGRLVFGRNNLRGSLSRTADGYAIALAGSSFDLAPHLEEQSAPADSGPAEAPAPPLRGPVYDVTVDLGQVLTKRGKLDGASGHLRVQGGRVLSTDLTGRVGQGTMVRTLIAPSDKGRRLTIETADMGAVLKSLGWLEGMFGGDMRLQGEFDDSRAGSPLRGTLRIGPYKLIKTPVVGDVLSVAPVTDALSAFSGSGLEFDRLLAPFAWHRGMLALNNARTSGTALGLTASGRINTNSDTVQIEGVIVPAYVLNSLIGNIPLIGPLITGGPGGGIFAINYAVEGPVAKPTVSTNPLSAIAPGFLRNLFGAGSGEDPTAETPPQTEPGRQPSTQPAPAAPTPLLPRPQPQQLQPPPAEQLRQ
ncbi:MAG: AsmA-like C-terminal region-containing protein [Reyranellaceae bacterium]